MAARTVMDRKAARGRDSRSTSEVGKRGSFRTSRLVIALVALAPVPAAGFALATLLGSDLGDVSVGAALAVVYVSFIVLAGRRGRSEKAELERRTDEMKAGYESVIAVLCAALDLRDNVAQGHARRVSDIASVVAWQMGLRKEHLRQIQKAAILHDIGKIGVADVVLSKRGPLDDAEWAEMKRHAELGYEILNGIDFLRDAAEVVYAHHERYDGSGYPRGLKGDLIPLGARVFAVVDAYDAMTSHRPYRKAMPHQRAVDEIVRNSGTQFDPEVVRAFVEAERRGLLADDLAGRDRPEAVSPVHEQPVRAVGDSA